MACSLPTGNPESLARQMHRLASDPDLAVRLGSRGYLQSEDGNVPDIKDHALAVEDIYANLLRQRGG